VRERERAKVLLDEALTKVATIKLKVAKAGADVLVNGVMIGRTPLLDPIFVEPGSCVVEARLEGYDAVKRSLTVAAGATQDLDIAFQKTAAATEPSVAQGPASPVVAPDHDGPDTRLLLAGGITAGVAVGAGLVFTILASGNASTASEKLTALEAKGGDNACLVKSLASACEELHGLRQNAATFGNVAVWSFIGAGVAGTGTLIYALATPRRQKEPSIRAVPLVSIRGGGLMVSGSW
jgi:hypothetical protein